MIKNEAELVEQTRQFQHAQWASDNLVHFLGTWHGISNHLYQPDTTDLNDTVIFMTNALMLYSGFELGEKRVYQEVANPAFKDVMLGFDTQAQKRFEQNHALANQLFDPDENTRYQAASDLISFSPQVRAANFDAIAAGVELSYEHLTELFAHAHVVLENDPSLLSLDWFDEPSPATYAEVAAIQTDQKNKGIKNKPGTITAYRGFSSTNTDEYQARSFTTSYEVALKFAHNERDGVKTYHIPVENVIAYTDERDEREVIALSKQDLAKREAQHG